MSPHCYTVDVITRNRWTWMVVILAFFATSTWAQDEGDAVADSVYRFGPGDKLQVNVFNEPDLSGEYTLDGEGQFSMHLIGQVNAAGLSSNELEAYLITQLKPDYLVNPRVSVQVRNYRPFYIIGEVNSPSAYAYVDGMTYLTAVAIAGGYTYRAKKNYVYVVRGDAPGNEELKLDVNDRVLPGDIVRIAERIF